MAFIATDFNETGLPFDPVVFNSFTIYNKSIKEFPDEDYDNRRLRIAQLLTKTGCTDNELIAAALLMDQPLDSRGAIVSLFGERVAQVKDELIYQAVRNFSFLKDADDPIKLLYMATRIIHLQITEGKGKSIQFHKEVFNNIKGTTSCPQLEERYQDILDQYSSVDMSMFRQMDDADVLESIYPAFEETRLADHEQIRAAYKAVVRDPGTQPETFIFALYVAETLSNVPNTLHPAAIAAALLDISIIETEDRDLDRWGDEIGQDVKDILDEGTIRSRNYRSQIESGSQGFKQIALAVIGLQAEDAYAMLEAMVESAKKNRNFSLDIFNHNFEVMKTSVEYIQKIVRPAMNGASGSPELEDFAARNIKDVLDLIERNGPQPPSYDQKPPKPPSPGPHF